jgi:hypothetical protein
MSAQPEPECHADRTGKQSLIIEKILPPEEVRKLGKVAKADEAI